MLQSVDSSLPLVTGAPSLVDCLDGAHTFCANRSISFVRIANKSSELANHYHVLVALTESTAANRAVQTYEVQWGALQCVSSWVVTHDSAAPMAARAGNPSSTVLARAVLRAVTKALPSLDDDERRTARAAAANFERVSLRLATLPLPWIEVSDCGHLTLQWERDGSGIVLLFAGDDLCTISTKSSPGEFYASNMVDYPLNEIGGMRIERAIRGILG